MTEKLTSRILIVDDNEAIHEDFHKILKSRETKSRAVQDAFFGDTLGAPSDSLTTDFELESALQGELGLQTLLKAQEEGRPFDLAFVDMRMPPGWDGVETIRRLWGADPSLEIVICSAYSDYSWHEITDELGVSDRLLILKKPFDNVEILQIAASLSTKRRLARENAEYQKNLEQKVEEKTQELRSAMHRLQASKQFLQSSMDSLDTQLAILNSSGEILFQNLGWAIGRTPLVAEGCCEGENYLEFCSNVEGSFSEVAENLANAIRKVSVGALDQYLNEYTLDNGNETPWYMTRVVPFRDDSQQRVVVLHENITEHKLLQNQLSSAKRLESIGQLTVEIVNEINEPVQNVERNLDSLAVQNAQLLDYIDLALTLVSESQEQGFAPEITEKLSALSQERQLQLIRADIPATIRESQDGIRQVTEVVGAMSELSLVSSEGLQLVDLNRVLETTKAVSASHWKEFATCDLELAPKVDAVDGFQAELHNVFLNIIRNAAQSIEKKFGTASNEGRITLRTKQEQGFVRVEIEDNGVGIPDEHEDHISKTFDKTKEIGQGNGQGLSIAYQTIVEKMGGRIEFESSVGWGTKFITDLPATSANYPLVDCEVSLNG
ncbi:MAG: ATP-binding protein [Planctomycetota bacterium]|nr:ATP-binding protein [Planctomycetota bacterium]